MAKVKLQFVCINDGVVHKDFISFLCNRCGGKMKKIGGTYICEECLQPNAKFECRLCESQQVSMQVVANV